MRVFILMFFVCFLFVCNSNNQSSLTNGEKNMTSGYLPYFNTPELTPDWEIKTHLVPPFSFKNQNGKIITNDDYKGTIQIADFFFTTCPGICPKLTKNMYNIQQYYKSDSIIKLVSFSVMPWIDKVDQLKNYSIANNIDSYKWNLLTGDKEKVYSIARNGYFADENYFKNQNKSDFIHTENFILVDPEGYIRGVYNGTIEFDIERLKRHISILKKEFD